MEIIASLNVSRVAKMMLLANQIHEQHVYGNGRYLYFENDILVAIVAKH
jgi:hypothetical protein